MCSYLSRYNFSIFIQSWDNSTFYPLKLLPNPSFLYSRPLIAVATHQPDSIVLRLRRFRLMKQNGDNREIIQHSLVIEMVGVVDKLFSFNCMNFYMKFNIFFSNSKSINSTFSTRSSGRFSISSDGESDCSIESGDHRIISSSSSLIVLCVSQFLP